MPKLPILFIVGKLDLVALCLLRRAGEKAQVSYFLKEKMRVSNVSISKGILQYFNS